MNKELLEALNLLEKEKDINKDTLLEAIENSLLQACKGHFGRIDNIHVHMDRETCDYELYAEKEVVETVEDPVYVVDFRVHATAAQLAGLKQYLKANGLRFEPVPKP